MAEADEVMEAVNIAQIEDEMLCIDEIETKKYS